ncbi:MAG: DUF2177 family protein [Candidatus Saccharibacteria bacterium]
MDLNFSQQIITYFISLASFLLIDLTWLGLIASKFYKDNLNGLMSKKPIWSVAILFYAVFIFGLMYFVIVPALSTGSYKTLITRAAIFGFVTYATYDLTNLSTLKNWPKSLTVVDLIWGAVLSTLVSLIAFTIAKKIFG